jgi:hypothetical protein
VAELDKLAPEPGEEAELDTRRRMMQAAERLRGDVARAGTALGEDGAERPDPRRHPLAGRRGRRRRGAAGRGIEALGRALTRTGEAQGEVDACLDALDPTRRRWSGSEERLFALRALARKHGVAPTIWAPMPTDPAPAAGGAGCLGRRRRGAGAGRGRGRSRLAIRRLRALSARGRRAARALDVPRWPPNWRP